MVLLDKTQVVEIIDHEACSLAHALRGGIAEPVQPFQACTIAEMKARDWIHRLATRCFRAEIVESRKAENDWTKRHTCSGRGASWHWPIEPGGSSQNFQDRQ